LAWDCIPSIRCALLKAIKEKPRTVRQLCEITGFPRSTVYYHLRDLETLKVVVNMRVPSTQSNFVVNMDDGTNDDAVKMINPKIKLPPLPKEVRPE